MKRFLPSPALSLALLVLWLLLMQSFGAGTILIGVALALFWPVVAVRIGARSLRPRRPLAMLTLFGRVLADMLRSNAHVAWAILVRPRRALRSGFVHIPLDLTAADGLSVLAMIVTVTPGTAWAELSADRRLLSLHVLDVADEQTIVDTVKQRYERPLREIFE